MLYLPSCPRALAPSRRYLVELATPAMASAVRRATVVHPRFDRLLYSDSRAPSSSAVLPSTAGCKQDSRHAAEMHPSCSHSSAVVTKLSTYGIIETQHIGTSRSRSTTIPRHTPSPGCHARPPANPAADASEDGPFHNLLYSSPSHDLNLVGIEVSSRRTAALEKTDSRRAPCISTREGRDQRGRAR